VSNLISLRVAMAEIRGAYDGGRAPFFFVVGAGVSAPTVPLAWQIIEHCRERAGGDEGPQDPLDRYGYWLQRAYPQPKNRQDFFRSLIAGKPISDSALRLAHIVCSRAVTNLVVTTNFDDFIARALAMFAEPHLVCDHPQTVRRIDLDDHVSQIVHVHGSYHFYDCRNLRPELENTARPSAATTQTMSAFLDRVLATRAPLVVGYSGWEGDVITSALYRALNGATLPYCIYWFCYRLADAERLPVWLRAHENVRLVVPAGPAAQSSSVEPPGSQPEPTLAARDVFDAMIQAFALEAPALTKDPLGFFARQLRQAIGVDGGDLYFLRDTIRRVERAAERDQEARSSMERVRDAVRRSQYEEVAREADGAWTRSLDPEERLELLEAVHAAADGLPTSSLVQLRADERVIALGSLPDLAPEILRLVASSAVRRGVTLGRLEDPEGELIAYDFVVGHFGASDDVIVQDFVASALFQRGLRFAAMRRMDEAIAAATELIRRFERAQAPILGRRVLAAVFSRAVWLSNVGRLEEALADYELLIERCGNNRMADTLLATALLNRGITLGALGRRDEAFESYGEAVRRFAESAEPNRRAPAANALMSQVHMRLAEERTGEALALLEDYRRRFADDAELTGVSAEALYQRARLLALAGERQQSMRAADELCARFGDLDSIQVRKWVVDGLALKSEQQTIAGDHAGAARTVAELVRRCGEEPDLLQVARAAEQRLFRP
jgi:tetratricopeptide (TPR) repeat protein